MNHIRETDEGFGRYQSLREKGYSKEEALRESSKDLVMMIASTKIDDKLLKNNKVDERLFGKNGFVDKANENFYNKANVIGELKNEFHDELTPKQWSQYYKKIAETGRLNSPIGDVFIYRTGDKIVVSKRVFIGEETNDYQVQKVYRIKGNDSKQVAKDVAKIMERTGNYYDAEGVFEQYSAVIGNNGGTTIFTRYDRRSGSYATNNKTRHP